MNKATYTSFIFIMLLLAACHPVVTTAIPTLIKVSSATSSVTLPPTTTPTGLPPTAIPTRIPPTPKPTLSPEDIAGSVLTELSIDETHSYSPDGFCKWKRILAWPTSEAASLKYDKFFSYVTVSCGNQDPWIVTNEWAAAQMGYSIPDLLGWSVDVKYLYFYDSVIPDGCQPPGGFQQDLRQVDLATGKIRAYPIAWTGGMALSPDTSKLVYYDFETARVGVYDLITGVELRFPFELPKSIEYWFAGDFTWAPDGQMAVFIIQYGDPCFPTGDSLRLVDLQRNKIQTLLEKENQILSIVEWTQPDRVLISVGKENRWLDPISGSLVAP